LPLGSCCKYLVLRTALHGSRHGRHKKTH
jgi:hypothetical protein